MKLSEVNGEMWGMLRGIHAEELAKKKRLSVEEPVEFELPPPLPSRGYHLGSRRRTFLPPPPKIVVETNPRPGEVRLKQFIIEEAKRLQLSTTAIYARWSRGHYRHMPSRHATSRTVFVIPKSNL